MSSGSKKRSESEKLVFLADRMAILMVICKSRNLDWNPWFRDGMYDDESSMGQEIRGWPDYKTAKKIIKNMLRRYDDEPV